MQAINLIDLGNTLPDWQGNSVAELGDIKIRLFHLTPAKEMIMDEEGHITPEWLLVLKGSIKVQTPHGELRLKTGDSFIIPPGTDHRLNVDDAPAIGLIARDMRQDPAKSFAGVVVDRIS